MNAREVLAREALRLHERYQRELIERFSVCPWARPARLGGRIRAHVVTEAWCSPAELRPLLSRWAADETIDVGFVIAPRFTAGAQAFSEWVASMGDQLSEVFLTAPFYPNAPESAGAIHFLRQTPDPTAQLVRRTSLQEIRSQDPPHYTDIFDLDLRDLEAEKAPRTVAASVLAHNERMIAREGRAQLQEILEDIRADRERTYSKLMPLL